MERPVFSEGRALGPQLLIASALFLGTCVLWILAAILDVTGPVGAVGSGLLGWAAMVLDLPAALLLATVYRRLADRARGSARWLRLGVAWALVTWVVLSLYWRFALPLVASTNVQDLFEGFLGAYPGGLATAMASPDVVLEMLGLWIVAAAVFAIAQALIVLDYRRAAPEDWVRGLPVYAWLAGSLVSLAGTAAIVVGVLPLLGGGVLGDGVTTGAILKLLVAPNLLVTGYWTSLRLGHTVSRMERAAAAS